MANYRLNSWNLLRFIIVEGPPPCQSGVWVFEFSASPLMRYKVLRGKGFYMEHHCEKPVEGWHLIVLTLLTITIYNPADSKKIV
jgi:hypothetical protein